jgi:hypothetical protein
MAISENTIRGRWILLAAVCAAVLCAACGGEEKGEAPAAKGDVEKPKAAQPEKRSPVDVFAGIVDAFNTSNAAEMRSSFSEDAAWWGPCSLRGPARGVREIMRSLVAFKGLVPDAKITIRRVLHRDEMVVAQTVTVGTKKWTEHGTEAAPKRLGFDGIYFVLADKGGRARETLLYFDQGVSMRQVGVLAGEVRPIPEVPAGAPEIVEGAETDGTTEVAVAALNAFARKGESFDALVAPGFAYFDTKTGRKLGAAELPEYLAAQRLTESGLAYTVQQTLAIGQYVALRWEAAGRFPGKGNVGPTDIVLHGAHVFTFVDGKIAYVEVYDSDLEYLQKTGLIAEAVKGDNEDALGPRGSVPGVKDVEDSDKIGGSAAAQP